MHARTRRIKQVVGVGECAKTHICVNASEEKKRNMRRIPGLFVNIDETTADDELCRCHPECKNPKLVFRMDTPCVSEEDDDEAGGEVEMVVESENTVRYRFKRHRSRFRKSRKKIPKASQTQYDADDESSEGFAEMTITVKKSRPLKRLKK